MTVVFSSEISKIWEVKDDRRAAVVHVTSPYDQDTRGAISAARNLKLQFTIDHYIQITDWKSNA